jgi:hypothetical protein
MRYFILFVTLTACTFPSQTQREVLVIPLPIVDAIQRPLPLPIIEEIKEQKKVIKHSPLLFAPCKGIEESDIEKKVNQKLDCIEGVLK